MGNEGSVSTSSRSAVTDFNVVEQVTVVVSLSGRGPVESIEPSG